MSIFIKAMSKAISDYRQILKKYLSTEERAQKIEELKLRDPKIFKSDLGLYEVAQAIVADIEKNIKVPDEGYYSYYGIVKFNQYVKEYLSHYTLDNGVVVHKQQKASRALVEAIQMLALPADKLDEYAASTFRRISAALAEFGSKEQQELYLLSLSRECEKNSWFYTEQLKYYQELKKH